MLPDSCAMVNPGNAATIRPRFTGRSLIAVPVLLDGTGPYDFVVDTGAQITTIDPVTAGKEIPVKPDVDGVLPTMLFRSVLISYADHFAVLDPR